MHEAGNSIRTIATQLDLTRNTVLRYLRLEEPAQPKLRQGTFWRSYIGGRLRAFEFAHLSYTLFHAQWCAEARMMFLSGVAIQDIFCQ